MLTVRIRAGFLPRRRKAPIPEINIRMIDKTYQPSDVEPRISRPGKQARAFRAGRPDRAVRSPIVSSFRRPT